MKKLFLSFILSVFCVSALFAGPADLEKAMNLLNEGKTDEAIAIVKEQLKNNPDVSDNYLAMGIIELEQNNYPQAQEYLKKALKIDRKIIAAHYMLAMIYEKEGDTQKAADKWQKILKYSKDETLRALADKHIKQLKGE